MSSIGGTARAIVFQKPDDSDAFLDLMAESSVRTPMRILAYCLMPNHFHLALWPREDGDVSRWMHWLMTTHVRRHLGSKDMHCDATKVTAARGARQFL